MPFATHGRTDMNVGHPFHDFDNEAFAFEAVRIVAERGHRKVALVGPPQGLMFQRHTRTGFEKGLREFGLQEHWLSDIDIDSPTVEIKAPPPACQESRLGRSLQRGFNNCHECGTDCQELELARRDLHQAVRN
jgi:LacI family transcriptional regulator